MNDDVKVFRVKDHIEHQGIGGKSIIIDSRDMKISNTLTNDEVFDQSVLGNWACKNFVERRKDFNCNFPYKMYYGHVDGLGYVVAEDEIEEII